MRLISLLLTICLAGCATDLPQAGPTAHSCLKTGHERGELVQWRCEDDFHWIPDRVSHER